MEERQLALEGGERVGIQMLDRKERKEKTPPLEASGRKKGKGGGAIDPALWERLAEGKGGRYIAYQRRRGEGADWLLFEREGKEGKSNDHYWEAGKTYLQQSKGKRKHS